MKIDNATVKRIYKRCDINEYKNMRKRYSDDNEASDLESYNPEIRCLICKDVMDIVQIIDNTL